MFAKKKELLKLVRAKPIFDNPTELEAYILQALKDKSNYGFSSASISKQFKISNKYSKFVPSHIWR